MSNKLKSLPTLDFDCRSVGPGGTRVTMVPDEGGVRAIWENENCPYDSSRSSFVQGVSGHVREAHDGHNVSRIEWKKLVALVEFAKKKGWVKP